MVVIRLERPQTNLQAITSAGSSIFRRIEENKRKIEADKRIQELITGAREQGKEVTTTINPRTGSIGGVSIKDVSPLQKPFFETEGSITPSNILPSVQPQTGTRAVTAGGQPSTINLSQVLKPGGQTFSQQQITPSQVINPQSSNINTLQGQLIPKKLTEKRVTSTGVQTLTSERVPTTAEIQQETIKKATQAASIQGAKAAQKAEVGVLRASIASNTAFNEVVRFNIAQFKKFGVRPGDFFGLFDKFTPKQINEFKAAAVGAGREAAATVGMQIIPSARAVKMVDIFAKSSAEVGLTIEGNANNVGASMANAFGNALAINISIEMEDGTNKKIQDVTIDKQTGLPLSKLDFIERLRAFNDITQDFRNKTASNYILNIFERAPELLQPDFRQKLETSVEMEDARGNKALVDPNTNEIILEL